MLINGWMTRLLGKKNCPDYSSLFSLSSALHHAGNCSVRAKSMAKTFQECHAIAWPSNRTPCLVPVSIGEPCLHWKHNHGLETSSWSLSSSYISTKYAYLQGVRKAPQHLCDLWSDAHLGFVWLVHCSCAFSLLSLKLWKHYLDKVLD